MKIYKDYRSIQKSFTEIGELEVDHELEAISNSIKNILLTRKGSLPGRPEFGSDLYLVVFNQLDGITVKMAERYVREAIAKYEDRVFVTDVKIQRNDAFHRLMIDIYFRFRDNIGRTQTESVAVSFAL